MPKFLQILKLLQLLQLLQLPQWLKLLRIRHPISTINLHTDGMALVSTSDTFLEASRKLKFNFQFYATLIAPQFSLKLSRNLPRKVRTLNQIEQKATYTSNKADLLGGFIICPPTFYYQQNDFWSCPPTFRKLPMPLILYNMLILKLQLAREYIIQNL